MTFRSQNETFTTEEAFVELRKCFDTAPGHESAAHQRFKQGIYKWSDLEKELPTSMRDAEHVATFLLTKGHVLQEKLSSDYGGPTHLKTFMPSITATAALFRNMPLHSTDLPDTVGQVKADIVGAILRYRTILRQQQQRRSSSVTPYLFGHVTDRAGMRHDLESKIEDLSTAARAYLATWDKTQQANLIADE
jgi:hypothetical protein